VEMDPRFRTMQLQAWKVPLPSFQLSFSLSDSRENFEMEYRDLLPGKHS